MTENFPNVIKIMNSDLNSTVKRKQEENHTEAQHNKIAKSQ